MINVIAVVEVKENCIDEFLNAAKILVNNSKKEIGCIAYNLVKSENKKLEYMFIEIWNSEQDLQNHNQSQHFKQSIKLLNNIVVNTNININKLIY